MAKGRWIPHQDEGIVLRTWPFGEADLLLSLLTREGGVRKGVARHAMRSRRRFGGALEPGTHVRAHFAERPREDLVRLDSFDILWSPLRDPLLWLQMAGIQLVLEVLEQALPEQAPEDNIFRLALAVLTALPHHPFHMPVTYFAVWMCRLMGWWPELGHCTVCGLDLRGAEVWWSPVGDGVTCADDRRPGGHPLRADDVQLAYTILRTPLPTLLEHPWTPASVAGTQRFALAMLERHLDRRLRSALAFHAGDAQPAGRQRQIA